MEELIEASIIEDSYRPKLSILSPAPESIRQYAHLRQPKLSPQKSWTCLLFANIILPPSSLTTAFPNQ